MSAYISKNVAIGIAEENGSMTPVMVVDRRDQLILGVLVTSQNHPQKKVSDRT
jgi:hypothetical protein